MIVLTKWSQKSANERPSCSHYCETVRLYCPTASLTKPNTSQARTHTGYLCPSNVLINWFLFIMTPTLRSANLSVIRGDTRWDVVRDENCEKCLDWHSHEEGLCFLIYPAWTWTNGLMSCGISRQCVVMTNRTKKHVGNDINPSMSTTLRGCIFMEKMTTDTTN